MIELFTRRMDALILPESAALTPLPIDDDISSLSAILLNKEYYEFLLHGRVQMEGITILDTGYLIPFKAKAWLDLTNRKSAGENVDSKDIRTFLQAMRKEVVDTKQLGLTRSKETILEVLQSTYLSLE